MDIISKKFILPAISLLFLLVVFLDQNSTQVPLKLILGSPLQLSLSTIIIVSILVGAGGASAGLFILNKVREKWKKNS